MGGELRRPRFPADADFLTVAFPAIGAENRLPPEEGREYPPIIEYGGDFAAMGAVEAGKAGEQGVQFSSLHVYSPKGADTASYQVNRIPKSKAGAEFFAR